MLNNCPQENIGSHQKMIPYVQGQKRCHSRMVGGVKLHLESNPIPTRDIQRAQTNLVCTRTQRPHRDWDRTVFECLLQRYGSALDCFRGRDSGCSKPWYVISPLGRGHQIPHHRVTRTYTGLGNRLLEGTNKILCTPGPRRKEQWPHKRLTQTCPWVSRSLQWRRGSVVACCRVGGTECSMRHFNGGRHYLYYFHHSLASGQITGREYSPAHWQKIKDLLSMAPPIRTRPSFPLSQSLPSGGFHKPLILLHQRVMGLVTLKTQENCLATIYLLFLFLFIR